MLDGKKKLCFVLDHQLQHYRLSFFEALSNAGFCVFIYHPGPVLEFSCQGVFQVTIKLNLSGGVFFVSKIPFERYDAVIHMQNLRMTSLWRALLCYRSVYTWGIGTSSARGLGHESVWVRLLRWVVVAKAKKTFLYSDFPINSYPKPIRSKVCIALNTVYVDLESYNNIRYSAKNRILCLGTLSSRKRFDFVLIAFKHLLSIRPDLPQKFGVDIVGDGSEYERLNSLVDELDISDRVRFYGRVVDLEDKEKIFASALVCCSPAQAGLSVLESFGYGVPFIALKNAISGGEHLNILDGSTGWLLGDENELPRLFDYVFKNIDKVLEMGGCCHRFYSQFAKVDDMAGPFIEEMRSL